MQPVRIPGWLIPVVVVFILFAVFSGTARPTTQSGCRAFAAEKHADSATFLGLGIGICIL